MKIEGNRVPDFLDKGGVLRTVHRKPPAISRADYLEAEPVINPSFDLPREQVDQVVEVVELASGVINDCSPKVMSESAFNRHLSGDPEPIKFGSLEVDHEIW